MLIIPAIDMRGELCQTLSGLPKETVYGDNPAERRLNAEHGAKIIHLVDLDEQSGHLST
jgi:phosphoribosylformimino-5-aminoimidazole carboxamide ribonucleotide (ProFAR) isomerase